MRAPEEPKATTRVVVVDDERAFADALGFALSAQRDLDCTGIAGTIAAGLDLVEATAPDVVVMDVRLPDGDGIEGTARIKESKPRTRVVVLTAHSDPDVMARAAVAGASGFLPKDSPVTEIVHAVRTAGDGGMFVGSGTLRQVLARLTASGAQPALPDDSSLSPRESEVLGLLAEGMDVKTVSANLSISVHTCRGHVKAILEKLHAHSQLEAVVTALRRGILPAPR